MDELHQIRDFTVYCLYFYDEVHTSQSFTEHYICFHIDMIVIIWMSVTAVSVFMHGITGH